jgi:hypothetical protein
MCSPTGQSYQKCQKLCLAARPRLLISILSQYYLQHLVPHCISRSLLIHSLCSRSMTWHWGLFELGQSLRLQWILDAPLVPSDILLKEVPCEKYACAVEKILIWCMRHGIWKESYISARWLVGGRSWNTTCSRKNGKKPQSSWALASSFDYCSSSTFAFTSFTVYPGCRPTPMIFGDLRAVIAGNMELLS